MHRSTAFQQDDHRTSIGRYGDIFRNRTQQLIATTLASHDTPWQFNATCAWKIPKMNGAEGCKGWRLVHGSPPLAKAFFRYLWNQQDKTDPPHHAYGCIQGRSREEAVLAAQILTWRATNSGHIAISDYHDLRAAFQSFNQSHICNTLGGHYDAETSIFAQHVTKSSFVMQQDAHEDWFQLKGG